MMDVDSHGCRVVGNHSYDFYDEHGKTLICGFKDQCPLKSISVPVSVLAGYP